MNPRPVLTKTFKMESQEEVQDVAVNIISKTNFFLKTIDKNENIDMNIQHLITQDISACIPICLDAGASEDLNWGKSLDFLPVFTRREIDNHVKNCGKLKGKSIVKTLVRGRKFKDERYISSESVYTARTLRTFIAKCSCRASMKKLSRHVVVHINRRTSNVEKARCNCPAGLSGYCNHVMALLLELAEYSLNSLSVIPEELACTSQLRKWGVPGNKEAVKSTVMKTSIHKNVDKKRYIFNTV